MINVQVRSTARIPIVLFTDPLSGLDCDISFNNPLAIRNTLLLASYSIIDVRVRELAYVIKHWAKRRHMNSPQEGTLSSYGYLLCLVHFLQTRSPPVVPNLQRLAPDWDPNMPPHIQAQLPLPKRWEKHPVEELYCNTYFYEASFQPQMHGPPSQSKLQVWLHEECNMLDRCNWQANHSLDFGRELCLIINCLCVTCGHFMLTFLLTSGV